HNLEDGGVVVQYNCECPDLVAKLKAIVDKYDRHVILAPYPGMKHKIALTAWTRLDTMDELDEGRVTRFIQAYPGIDHHKYPRPPRRRLDPGGLCAPHGPGRRDRSARRLLRALRLAARAAAVPG